MELLDYLSTFSSAEDKAAFAVRVGTTIGHLKNVAYGIRVASAALAAQIEVETGGAVPVSTLRPDDWQKIWDPRRNQLIYCGGDCHAKDAQAIGVSASHAAATSSGAHGNSSGPEVLDAA